MTLKGIIGLLLLPWLIYVGIRGWSRRRAAPSWPTASGTIMTAETKLVQRGETWVWIAEFAYSYTVNGEYYAGYYERSARGENRAWQIVEAWAGRSVLVPYKPNHPDDSELLPSDQPGSLIGN